MRKYLLVCTWLYSYNNKNIGGITIKIINKNELNLLIKTGFIKQDKFGRYENLSVTQRQKSGSAKKYYTTDNLAKKAEELSRV